MFCLSVLAGFERKVGNCSYMLFLSRSGMFVEFSTGKNRNRRRTRRLVAGELLSYMM